MRSPRVIGIIFIKDDIVVQSEIFKYYYPIGSLNKSVEYLNSWGVDEIIILDINSKKINYNLIKSSLSNLVLPTCYGGGINNETQINQLLNCGIDKVSFNNLLLNRPEKILNFSKKYGKQFIIGSIDIIEIKNKYFIYNHKSKKILKGDPVKKIIELEKFGIGEFLINFIDRDGTGLGLNIDFSKKLINKLNVPVVVTGGAKNIKEIIKFVKKTNFTPAIGNLFNHFENSVRIVKEEYLSNFHEIRDPEYKHYKINNLESFLGRNEN